MWFLFGEVSSSSGCLRWALLFYCGTPCAFHIIISATSIDGCLENKQATFWLRAGHAVDHMFYLYFDTGVKLDGKSIWKIHMDFFFKNPFFLNLF